jgi:pimeloyl-ACP methyl ester carboxylesterase
MAAPTEAVLLLHGMGRRAASMARLGRFLEGAGYAPSLWDYPSRRATFQEHGARLALEVARLDADPGVSRIHFVSHSLGGIVARHALSLGLPGKLGRLVMLAPPNRGSRLARILAPVLGALVKPLAQLSDAPGSDVNRMPALRGVDVGVIAAERDGKVRVADTHLDGQADHLVVPGFHTFIMDRADVHEAVLRFLRTGKFEPDEPVRASSSMP